MGRFQLKFAPLLRSSAKVVALGYRMTSAEFLRSEIDRLTAELQQACQEKVQAAEYGLAVLEEKHKLQERHDELENTFEATRQELECLREVRGPMLCS